MRQSSRLILNAAATYFRMAVTVGFLGGFTTYSAFNYETTTILRERGATPALLNLGLTLGGCFVVGLLGVALARRFAGG